MERTNFDSVEIGVGPRESEFLKSSLHNLVYVPGRELPLQVKAQLMYLVLKLKDQRPNMLNTSPRSFSKSFAETGVGFLLLIPRPIHFPLQLTLYKLFV